MVVLARSHPRIRNEEGTRRGITLSLGEVPVGKIYILAYRIYSRE